MARPGPGAGSRDRTRQRRCQPGEYADFNLATHVDDAARAVARNRALLAKQLELPDEPQWLQQIHGAQVIDLDKESSRRGDAAVTTSPGRVAAILTADCLPVLLCHRGGEGVAVAHCGWRGLAAGVLANTVARLGQPEQLLAWLGPAISQGAYEVGAEVRQAFVDLNPDHGACFIENDRGRWQANLYALARRLLEESGVTRVFGGGFCTYYDHRRFYSFRRQGLCGRMATLIWLTQGKF